MTLIVKFHIEDETFSIVKIVTDMQENYCCIEVPLLTTSLYFLTLVISKASECFSKKKKEKEKILNDGCKEKKRKVHCMICLYTVDGARTKVMLMKGIITFISNSNHKIQVNLLGYLYGT